MKIERKTNSEIRNNKEKLVMENFASIMKKLDTTFLIESKENNISIVDNSYEDIGLGKMNTKFSDGTEIIWDNDDKNISHPSSRYLNGKDINTYVNILRAHNVTQE